MSESRPPRTRTAYQTAIRLLSRRELSAAQLRDRLLARDLPATEVAQAIARLTTERLVDDARAAAAHARRLVGVRHRGALRARREIEALGIAPETARRAVDAVVAEIGDTVLLERAIARRLRGPIRDRAHFRRVYQALLRQGFRPDEVARALVARAGGDPACVEE